MGTVNTFRYSLVQTAGNHAKTTGFRLQPEPLYPFPGLARIACQLLSPAGAGSSSSRIMYLKVDTPRAGVFVQRKMAWVFPTA